MSLCTISQCLDRISSAPTNSPLVIYRHGRMVTRLGCVYAEALVTRQQLATGELDVVGTYHGGMDLAAIKLELAAALPKPDLEMALP